MRGAVQMQITTIGLDIAKNVFQVHGIDANEKVVLRKQLRRGKLIAFFEALPPCLIGVEACATAHHWARELTKLGHEVRLMPAKDVKAYVKRNKNDVADAAAICEAVRRPTMRFVGMHWGDPTSLELLRGIAERGALAPLFVVITARPDFRVPWSARSHHTTISLSPLDRNQIRDMVGELASRRTLPKEVVEGVADRTGGVPLFVEEVTRLLLERGDGGGIQAIPPTLQQSLTARLDRLGPAREVARIAAVIGRDFSHRLIRAVAGIEDTPLQTALERLAEADILLVQGLPPESDYRFKHALIQDAAYENLLKSRRQLLHRRVAEALLEDATATAEPELLGHHFTQAGLTETAIEWWSKAGEQSLERSDLVEAIEQFMRAVDLIATLPSTPQSYRR